MAKETIEVECVERREHKPWCHRVVPEGIEVEVRRKLKLEVVSWDEDYPLKLVDSEEERIIDP